MNLGDACVAQALAIIARDGLEALSLREVARRVGVSHQAPYRHYPTRDHLLAEVIRRCFREFADALEGSPDGSSAREDLRALGRTYLCFACEQPLKYRLMFGTRWPDGADHPELLRDARCAFDVLRRSLRRLRAGEDADEARIDLDAMVVWSSMHGLATILQSDVARHLDMPQSVRDQVVPHALAAIDRVLTGP